MYELKLIQSFKNYSSLFEGVDYALICYCILSNISNELIMNHYQRSAFVQSLRKCASDIFNLKRAHYLK